MSSEMNLSALSNTHAMTSSQRTEHAHRRLPMLVALDSDSFEKASDERASVSVMSREKLIAAASGGGIKDTAKKALTSLLMKGLGIRYPYTNKALTAEQKAEIKASLKPGDILLSLDPGYPGWQVLEKVTADSNFTHASLYEGDGKIIEALSGDGITRTELDDTLNNAALLEIIRPPYQGKEDLDAMLNYARGQIGKPYDSSFNTGDDKELYCSELVYWGLKSMPHPLEVKGNEFMGKKIVGPQSLETIPDAQIVFSTGASFMDGISMYSPVFIPTAACAAAGAAVGGPAGFAAGLALGWSSSIIVGNKIQTGKWGFGG